jgi:hypothetical protein
LTRAEVAWLVGMSDSWVRDRMQAGDFPRPGQTANEYVEAHVDFKVRKLATSGEGTASFEVERTRLTKEQADKIATANALDRKELASLPDMTMAVTSVIAVSMGHRPRPRPEQSVRGAGRRDNRQQPGRHRHHVSGLPQRRHRRPAEQDRAKALRHEVVRFQRAA